jgi:hypothetical protein
MVKDPILLYWCHRLLLSCYKCQLCSHFTSKKYSFKLLWKVTKATHFRFTKTVIYNLKQIFKWSFFVRFFVVSALHFTVVWDSNPGQYNKFWSDCLSHDTYKSKYKTIHYFCRWLSGLIKMTRDEMSDIVNSFQTRIDCVKWNVLK